MIAPRATPATPLREAPHNVELEQALLGAILVNNDAFHRLPKFLKPGHFREPLHQKIFEIAAGLIGEGKVASPITIKTFLPSDIDIAGLTINQYLARLAAEATTVINAADYGHSVYDLATRRSLIEIGEEMIAAAYEAPADASPGMIAADAREALDQIATSQTADGRAFRPIDMLDLLDLAIPPREMIVAPIIPEKGLVMLYAARGFGKTHVAHGIACSAASGGAFLRWRAPRPRRVLLVDGEIPASELQKRLASVIAGASPRPARGMLNILAADLIDRGVGNLADNKVQTKLDQVLDGIELLILDNLSTLAAVIRDNDAESWSPIQEWLLRLRRRGISVLIVHHAGKSGEQRGTSRREDVLDTSISLRRPQDYVATAGAKFEIHIEKGRGIHGDDAKPFEAQLEVRDGACLWSMREIEDAKAARVGALHEDGLSVREIADQTGIPKSTVQRLVARDKAGCPTVPQVSQ
jgi:KaiC/GvpD/RAD55 family RecA-like ATPase